MKLIFLSILMHLCFQHKCISQYNLIPNFSFEDNVVCANSFSNGPLPAPWYLAQDLPNNLCYMNACATYAGFSVPSNNVGFQIPKSGAGYALTDFFHTAFFNGRGYLQAPLKSTLINNKSYYAEFWASLGNKHRYAVNNIAMLLTDTAVKVNSNIYPIGIGLIPANPQVYNYSNPIIKDTLNWVKISGVFTAQGGEAFITIGNFKDDANTQTILLHNAPGSSGKAGYYIDDVKLIPLDSMLLYADAGRDTTINLGDSAFIGSYINGITNINWLNSTGNIIATGTPFLYVKPTANTFYVLEQTVNGFYSRDTVNVNVNNVVPLVISNYELISKHEGIINNWQTLQEVNVAHFNIQFSVNGKDFTTVATVAAKNKAFNEYQLTHNIINEKRETLFYRIEAVDKDGKLTYSKILQTTSNTQQATFIIYPNPAKSIVQINFPKIKQIIISTLMGKLVKSGTFQNTNAATISIADLQRGVYFIKVLGNNNCVIQKLIVE